MNLASASALSSCITNHDRARENRHRLSSPLLSFVKTLSVVVHLRLTVNERRLALESVLVLSHILSFLFFLGGADGSSRENSFLVPGLSMGSCDASVKYLLLAFQWVAHFVLSVCVVQCIIATFLL